MSHFLGHFHDIKSPDWDTKLAAMRALTREHNKGIHWTTTENWRGQSYEKRQKWKIMVRYRLGRNNPDRALYHRGGIHYRWSGLRIHREHAQYAGVYLYKFLEIRNYPSY